MSKQTFRFDTQNFDHLAYETKDNPHDISVHVVADLEPLADQVMVSVARGQGERAGHRYVLLDIEGLLIAIDIPTALNIGQAATDWMLHDEQRYSTLSDDALYRLDENGLRTGQFERLD